MTMLLEPPRPRQPGHPAEDTGPPVLESSGLKPGPLHLARLIEAHVPRGEAVAKLTLSELAALSDRKPGTVARYLAVLEDSGLIERDGRSRYRVRWRLGVIPPSPRPPGRIGPRIPFNQFRAELRQLYSPPLRAKATLCKLEQALKIAEDLGARTVDDLSPGLIAAFITSRPPDSSPNTTHSLLRSLKAACSFAVEQGYIDRSPFEARKVWVRRSRPLKRRHHGREEIARVLAMLRDEVAAARGWRRWRARRLYALVATVAYTGMRRGEALHLQIEDLDFHRRVIHLVDRRDYRYKTDGSDQPVPMPSALSAILSAWVPHVEDPDRSPDARPAARAEAERAEAERDAGGPRWLFPNAIRCVSPWTGGPPGEDPLDQCKAAGLRAGVDHFTFQSLRHSWATHAEHWGISPAMIQRVLRHTSLRTQESYRHADLANLAAVASRVDFGPVDDEPRTGPGPMAAEDWDLGTFVVNTFGGPDNGT